MFSRAFDMVKYIVVIPAMIIACEFSNMVKGMKELYTYIIYGDDNG